MVEPGDRHTDCDYDFTNHGDNLHDGNRRRQRDGRRRGQRNCPGRLLGNDGQPDDAVHNRWIRHWSVREQSDRSDAEHALLRESLCHQFCRHGVRK